MIRSVASLLIGMVASVGVGAGCVEYALPIDVPRYPTSEPLAVEAPFQTDVIVQVSIPVVDVLFVIDDSCSMEDEQGALTANFPRFMDYFVGSGLDYHVGVVSTDLDSALGGKLRIGSDGSSYIDTSSLDPSSGPSLPHASRRPSAPSSPRHCAPPMTRRWSATTSCRLPPELRPHA